MLERTLNTQFQPSTNLKGQVAGANWVFVLPSLELGQVAYIGLPSANVLSMVARHAKHVVIFYTAPAQQSKARALIQHQSQQNISLVPISAQSSLPVGAQSFDLVVLSSSQQLLQSRGEIQRVLRPDGFVYVLEETQSVDLPGFSGPLRLWNTPVYGEMRTAVPMDDRDTIDYFLNNSLYSSALKIRPFRSLDKLVNQRLAQVSQRQSALFRFTEHSFDGPPQYIQQIAQESGIDVAGYRWGLAAHGEYTSRKVLMFLFKPGHQEPEYIVKITRDPAMNNRLENEQHALKLLHELDIVDSGIVPKLEFAGNHGNLAIVGESIIEGAPFRSRTSVTAGCPYFHNAIDWLSDLAEQTANRQQASAAEVASGLNDLLQRFTEIYRVSPAHQQRLAELIARLGDYPDPFPLVYQHGDPGVWNLLVTPDSRVAFLDWEAFEQFGMPLWDVFYLMRSFAVGVARRQGTSDSLRGLLSLMLSESPLSAYLEQAVREYRERLGLPQALVEPLFYTCWMHRSLKEATRLPAERIEQGHYIALLRMCLDNPNAPLLKAMSSQLIQV